MLHKSFCSLVIVTVALSAPVFMNKALAAEEVDLIFDANSIVEDTNLDDMRGAALDLEVLGVAFLDAISLNNSASGTFSGGNVINEGAFSDSSGLSTIIQNSGNNVLIQSATILTLNIE
jgi:hypothetical protein